MCAAAVKPDLLEKYQDLEKAGMAAAIAHAVKNFVLTVQKVGDFVTHSDFREYKAGKAHDLKTLQVHQDQKFDQIRSEFKDEFVKVRTEIREVRTELKDEITKVRIELKDEIGKVRTEIGEVRIELKDEIGKVRTELKDEIGKVHIGLKDEIGKVRTELKDEFTNEFGKIRSEMSNQKVELLRWMISLLFGQTGLIVSLIIGLKIFG